VRPPFFFLPYFFLRLASTFLGLFLFFPLPRLAWFNCAMIRHQFASHTLFSATYRSPVLSHSFTTCRSRSAAFPPFPIFCGSCGSSLFFLLFFFFHTSIFWFPETVIFFHIRWESLHSTHIRSGLSCLSLLRILG